MFSAENKIRAEKATKTKVVLKTFLHKTKKKHAEALKLAQEKTQTTQNNETQKESVTPLNVKYNKLTAGFRADTKLAR